MTQEQLNEVNYLSGKIIEFTQLHSALERGGVEVVTFNIAGHNDVQIWNDSIIEKLKALALIEIQIEIDALQNQFIKL